ncbi:hypothetical protein [Mucilaginibacter sp.]|uniref:hypothetical protein n=1 Tax=Mucilaginibacter sp. TaxID=1882438 RepID=UPI0035BBF050
MDTPAFSSSPLFIPLFFLVTSAVIVYLILKFDKLQKRKMQIMLNGTKDVKPLFMQKAAVQKLATLRTIGESAKDKTDRMDVARQLDELVQVYDKGQISLPDYCNRLNRLLAKVA